MKTIKKSRKVVITGVGDVGASFAYALMQSGLAEEIVLVDLNADLVQGQVLDLAHGLPFVPPVHVRAGTADDYADATVIVMTAGAKQRHGESRLELVNRNAAIVASVADDVVSRGSQAIMVIVSNPVDILTYVALRRSGLPKKQIMGSGTVLDSSRFRYLIGQHCGVDSRNVHAYILGEHGDSEFAAWSMTHIAGMPIADYCAVCGQCAGWQELKETIVQQVRDSAYHIIGYKGATYYAIGLALVRIVGAILRNERSVLAVSTLLEGELGIDDVCLSVPSMVGANGVERIVSSKLIPGEMAELAASAAILKETIRNVDPQWLSPRVPLNG